MNNRLSPFVGVLAVLLASGPVMAQAPAASGQTPGAAQPADAFGPPTTICGQQVGAPIAQPPANARDYVQMLLSCKSAKGPTSWHQGAEGMRYT